jgi:hypothetical protein
LIRLTGLLIRVLTMLICWSVLMGVPVLLFQRPLSDPEDIKRFLGVFYTLLLLITTLIGRSWGGGGVLGVALPFWAFFAVLAASKVFDPTLSGLEKAMWAANFGAILPVTWLGWRLGKRLPSPARDRGELM